MRYFIAHHQHKGAPIDDALKSEGWLFRQKRTDIALFDHAINQKQPERGRGLVNHYYAEGTTILTYPHGATGSWWTDSDYYPPNKKIFANLVIGEGHKHVEQITRPYLDHYVIGWSWCPVREFQKPFRVKRILFAPIHASTKTNLIPDDKKNTNTRVYKALLELSDRYRITVRYLNPLSTIGLWRDSRVNFKFGKPDGSYNDIDSADLVIAEGTYMYLSVARGKPTIGMHQYLPFSGSRDITGFKLKRWEEYKDYMAYPIDFDDGSLQSLIELATNEEQKEWKDLFIGKEMNSKNLANLLAGLRTQDISNR